MSMLNTSLIPSRRLDFHVFHSNKVTEMHVANIFPLVDPFEGFHVPLGRSNYELYADK